MPAGKRLGFVDYDLDNFHANIYLRLLRGDLAFRRFEVTACAAERKREGAVWAESNGVPYFNSVAEMNEHVDGYVVLAPSNPQCHLELCRQVFPFGKPCFVDKTFAPDYETAVRIFDLADQFRVPVQTTSALRYTEAPQLLGEQWVEHMVAWGGGSSFDEYGIHPLELTISCMGVGVQSLMRRGNERFTQLLLNFTKQRTAVVNLYVDHDTAFAASMTTGKRTLYVRVDESKLFLNAAGAILDFFDAGHALVPREQTLLIRRILDLAAKPEVRDGFCSLSVPTPQLAEAGV